MAGCEGTGGADGVRGYLAVRGVGVSEGLPGCEGSGRA